MRELIFTPTLINNVGTLTFSAELKNEAKAGRSSIDSSTMYTVCHHKLEQNLFSLPFDCTIST